MYENRYRERDYQVTTIGVITYGNTITIQTEIHNEDQVKQDGVQIDNLELDIINKNSDEPCEYFCINESRINGKCNKEVHRRWE